MKDALLWKRILNEGIFDDLTVRGKEQWTIDMIIRAPIIVDERSGERFDGQIMRWSRYTNLALPFQRFWVEGHNTVNRWGALVESEEPGCPTLLQVSVMLASPARVGFYGVMKVNLDSSGSLIVTDQGGLPAWYNISSFIVGSKGESDARLVCSSIVYDVLDTIQLLSCKNVSLSPRDNDPKQVRRAIKRHGNNAHGYRYHVLTVRPPGARKDSPGVEIGTMPRHVCRGHFAEYGPEFNKGLLFGKYAGRFYVPPHLKGKAENGIVEKDYAVTMASLT